MLRRSGANKMRTWKMERASVNKKRVKRAKSNKYSGGDTGATPKAYTRKQIWVGGYVKRDGTKAKGYTRKNPNYRRTG